MKNKRKVAIQIQHDDRWREMLKIAAESGFRAVAMGFGSSRCFHGNGWEKRVAEIREELDKNGLFCVMIHAPYYDLMKSAETVDPETEQALIRCVTATKTLGGSITVVHPRSVITEVEKDVWRVDGARSLAVNRENLSGMLNEAIKNGVFLGIENLPEFPGLPVPFYSCDPSDHVALIDSFKSENVCAIWDFGHANLMKYDMEQSIRTLGSRIRGTHVHNNDGKSDCHYPPFLPNPSAYHAVRTVDWKKALHALKSTGYDGYLTLEPDYDYNSPPEVLLRYLFESVCALEQVLRK